MEETPKEDNANANPQTSEKLALRPEYVFHIDSTNKKVDKNLPH